MNSPAPIADFYDPEWAQRSLGQLGSVAFVQAPWHDWHRMGFQVGLLVPGDRKEIEGNLPKKDPFGIRLFLYGDPKGFEADTRALNEGRVIPPGKSGGGKSSFI